MTPLKKPAAKLPRTAILLKRNPFNIMNKVSKIFNAKLNLFSTSLLILISLNLLGQSVQNRNWEYTKVVYTSSTKESTIITNSLPRGGGIVKHKGKEYNYFIFWASILNNSSSTLAVEIKFPSPNYFNSNKAHFIAALTKAEMKAEKVKEFDYGLTDIPALLNNASNQLKYLNTRILPQKEYLFYIPVFMHNTKWPVRAAFILKDKKLFYKITAGTDTALVPCGSLVFVK